MKQLVVVMNGKGGCGKDTLCEIAGRRYPSRMISAITPIKEIAAVYGWKGEKDARGRKFLSDLKRAFIDYNDLPNQYLVAEYEKFRGSDARLLFVHIREGDQIQKFQRSIGGKSVTLLVRRKEKDALTLGNESDDNVEDLVYDYIYQNDLPLDRAAEDFSAFFQTLLKKEDVLEDGDSALQAP